MGLFDDIARDLVPVVIELFVTVPSRIVREEAFHSPSTEEITIDRKTAEILISTPQNFKFNQIDGTRVQAGDLSVYVPAQALTDAGIDPMPTDDVSLSIFVLEKKYRVVTTEPLFSGDGLFMYGMQLRP